MASIHENITELVGNMPLDAPAHVREAPGFQRGKLECAGGRYAERARAAFGHGFAASVSRFAKGGCHV